MFYGSNIGIEAVFAIGAIAAVLGWSVTALVRRCAFRLGLIDLPNQRSMHVEAMPRGGGLSFVVVSLSLTAVTVLYLRSPIPKGTLSLWFGSFLVAVVSLADDKWGLSATLRFATHIFGAVILILGGNLIREIAVPWLGDLPLGLGAVPVTIFWVVGLTNAYNFMDGIDGLAAGQAVVACLAVAALAYQRGAETTALSMLILGGAVLGFLPHNWPPARIFMGDVGSAFLGFTFAGSAVLAGNNSGHMPFLLWVIALAPFIVDSTVTLIGRILRGEKWYAAHREHFYQRLVQSGWSHRAVTELYMSVAATVSVLVVSYYFLWKE